MPTTALEIFDTTLEQTNEWLDAISDELGWHSKYCAYSALRATLHALRDRLPINEVIHLGAQLPLLIRGMYYEGWRPPSKPMKIRYQDDFLAQVIHECGGNSRRCGISRSFRGKKRCSEP